VPSHARPDPAGAAPVLSLPSEAASVRHLRQSIANVAVRLAQLSERAAETARGDRDGDSDAPLGVRTPLAAAPAPEDSRLLGLASAFGLDPADLDVLLVAVAPELDRRFEVVSPMPWASPAGRGRRLGSPMTSVE
jgi:hypothetical protein